MLFLLSLNSHAEQRKFNLLVNPWFNLLGQDKWLDVHVERVRSEHSITDFGILVAKDAYSDGDNWITGFSVSDIYYFNRFDRSGFFVMSGFEGYRAEYRSSPLSSVSANQSAAFLYAGLGFRLAAKGGFNVSAGLNYRLLVSGSAEGSTYYGPVTASSNSLIYTDPLLLRLGIGYAF